MTQHREVDLLVAGAGPAGMTAALVASLQGLSVLFAKNPARSAAPERPRRARCGFPATIKANARASTTARHARRIISTR